MVRVIPTTMKIMGQRTPTTKGHLLHELHPTVLTQGVTQDPQHLRLLHVLRGVELPVPRQHRGKRWKISENRWDSMDSVDVEDI